MPRLTDQMQLSGLLKSFTGDAVADKELAATKLDGITDRVRGLKRKLDDLQPSPEKPSVLRDRLAYVDAALLAPPKESSPEVEVADGKEDGSGPAKPKSKDEVMDAEGAAVEAEVAAELTVEEVPSRPSSGGSGSRTPGDRTLDRYIVDHLLRTGRMKTARALAAVQDIENLVDVKLFAELVRIESALIEKHSCAEGLAWCGENRGTLKKQGVSLAKDMILMQQANVLQSDLEFALRMQEFVELCRKRDTVAAITYARKNLAPWGSSHMAEVQQAMTLLAFGETTGVALYRTLYDSSRWAVVRDQFRETFLGIYALPSQSLLALSLSAGLSSLRLPSCVGPSPPGSGLASPRSAEKSPRSLAQSSFPPAPLLPPAPDLHAMLGLDSLIVPEVPRVSEPGSHADETAPLRLDQPTANVDCPTCAPNMRVLAREVPMAHHVNSTLVCRISGAVMDSNNEPLAFPNGCVYSSKVSWPDIWMYGIADKQALAEMAKNNFDVVTCPRTNETCAFARLRKVYIS